MLVSFHLSRLLSLLGPSAAFALPIFAYYNCGSGAAAHCYGTVHFGARSFQGFATQVTAVPLLSGDGELTNEIWAVQDPNPSCDYNRCWIEIGLLAGTFGVPSNETHIFFADNRPNGGGFHFHDYGKLQSQELNHSVFLIIRPTVDEPNTFTVAAQTCADVNDATICAQKWTIGKSTSNSISVGEIVMGMELSGTTGASAPNSSFTQTVFLDPNAFFGGRYLTSDGARILNPPVNAGWTATPSSSSFGGIYFTSCCR